jgi:membrane protease YdiL (CAAX protease family)
MDIIFTALLFLWPAFLLWLANLADRNRMAGETSAANTLAVVAYGLVIASFAALIMVGLAMQGMALAVAQSPEMAESLRASGFDAESLRPVGLSLWAPSILGIVLLLRPVRALLAKVIPIGVDRTVHAVALSYIALILINLLFTLGVGIDTLADAMETSSDAGMAFNPVGSIWAQDIAMAVMGVIGVGWLARRRFSPALVRLGIVFPTGKQALIGLAVGLLMVPVVLLMEFLFGKIGLGADPDVERLTEQMIGPLTTSGFGILTLGLAAALGEETVFRGALQPRFGLLLTSLLFALLHSTYGLTLSTLIVFIVGMVLGLLRLRYNTTTSMITHAVYNMTLGVIAYLGLLENL